MHQPADALWPTCYLQMPATTVSVGARTSLLFDYYGFPDEAYKLRYPAPGSPAVAARCIELLKCAPVPWCLAWMPACLPTFLAVACCALLSIPYAEFGMTVLQPASAWSCLPETLACCPLFFSIFGPSVLQSCGLADAARV
jgi:hypothetical protein